MRRQKYSEYPKGCGHMSTGKKNDKLADLDLLIANGSRAQRRFAMRQLKILNKSRENNANR